MNIYRKYYLCMCICMYVCINRTLTMRGIFLNGFYGCELQTVYRRTNISSYTGYLPLCMYASTVCMYVCIYISVLPAAAHSSFICKEFPIDNFSAEQIARNRCDNRNSLVI